MSNIEDQPAASSTDAQPVTEADAPFDHVDADIILRSSDNVDFRVFKLLLSLGSPFFKDMFALPQASEGDPSSEMKDGLPVVRVTEGRKVLEALLLMCYPMGAVDPPAFEKLEDVALLLDAAIKYNVERVEKKAREMLVDQRFLSADPVRVFAIACRYRMEEEAKAAAKATLNVEIFERSHGPELELISAGKICRLLQYHKLCVAKAKEASTGFTWPIAPNINTNNQYTNQYCNNCDESYSYQSIVTRQNAPTAIEAILHDGRLPNQTDLKNLFDGAHVNTSTCPYCSTTIATGAASWSMTPTNMGELIRKFSDVLENAISPVNLELQL